MATLYARPNANLYAQWTDADRTPRQKRHSTGTRDRRLARQILERADAAYRLGQWDPWTGTLASLEPERPAEPVTVSEAVGAFLSDRADDYATLTLLDYRSVLGAFSETVGRTVPLARLTVADLTPYALSADVRRSTQGKRIGVLSAFYGWAVDAGHVKGNLARQVKRPKQRGAAHAIVSKAVTESELDAICQAVRDDHERRHASDDARVQTERGWMAGAFRFAFYTGLRASEISRLRWEAVDLDAATVTITEQKNGKADVLPLAPQALDVLADLAASADEGYVFGIPGSTRRTHRAWTTNLNAYFRDYRKAAGIDRNVTLHGLRHGFASHLAAKGKSAWVIQKACRHSSVTVSQVYVSLTNNELRSELADVFG